MFSVFYSREKQFRENLRDFLGEISVFCLAHERDIVATPCYPISAPVEWSIENFNNWPLFGMGA